MLQSSNKFMIWSRLACTLLLAFSLAACGSGSDDPPAANNPAIPNKSILSAVPANGTKTIQAGTADTHEVETDGNWIVWRGRTINMGYYNGTSVADLNLGIPLSVTPWPLGERSCEDAPVAFDGTTLVFAGKDTASAAAPRFYYKRPGTAAKSIEIPFDDPFTTEIEGFDLDDDAVYVHGSYAAVYDDSESRIYVARLSDAAPAFTELTFYGIYHR